MRPSGDLGGTVPTHCPILSFMPGRVAPMTCRAALAHIATGLPRWRDMIRLVRTHHQDHAQASIQTASAGKQRLCAGFGERGEFPLLQGNFLPAWEAHGRRWQTFSAERNLGKRDPRISVSSSAPSTCYAARNRCRRIASLRGIPCPGSIRSIGHTTCRCIGIHCRWSARNRWSHRFPCRD